MQAGQFPAAQLQLGRPLFSERAAPLALVIAFHAVMFYLLGAGLGFIPKIPGITESTFVDVPVVRDPEPVDDQTVDQRALVTKEPFVTKEPPVIPYEPDKVVDSGSGVVIPTVIDTIHDEPLFVAPRILKSFEPAYPNLARLATQEGVVQVRVWLSPLGAVTNAKVERSSGYTSLDDAAVKSVRLWKFAPARRGAEGIAGSTVVSIRFQLR